MKVPDWDLVFNLDNLFISFFSLICQIKMPLNYEAIVVSPTAEMIIMIREIISKLTSGR